MEYCELCSLSHDMKYRHLYTKRHIRNAKRACKNMQEKVNKYVNLLKSPEFCKPPYESQVKIWCYACSAEVVVHYMDPSLTVVMNYGAFLHFSSSEHAEAALKFLEFNRLLKTDDVKTITICTDTSRRVMSELDKKLKSFNITLQAAHTQVVKPLRQVIQPIQPLTYEPLPDSDGTSMTTVASNPIACSVNSYGSGGMLLHGDASHAVSQHTDCSLKADLNNGASDEKHGSEVQKSIQADMTDQIAIPKRKLHDVGEQIEPYKRKRRVT